MYIKEMGAMDSCIRIHPLVSGHASGNGCCSLGQKQQTGVLNGIIGTT